MAIHPILLRTIKCLTISMVLFLGPLCFGESVVVQVLNAKDGQPVPGKVVNVQLRFANPAHTMVLNQRSDANGETRIQLPEARPETLKVEVDLSRDAFNCSCQVLARTETVIREGLTVAGRSRGSKSSAPIQAIPGHILFIARPPSLLQKVLYMY